ncbi:MAG: pyridoxal 5'-phosphate synthase glutaminase subunit PdxT [Bacteroidaceae bacterium]|nr:pyridoxal 5'-phosphate synthase glutaminase subunit PdxT [Bacteroidaceae bacterium]
MNYELKIGVLALQGAFEEHCQVLRRLGVDSVLIRNLDDFNKFLPLKGDGSSGLILPGGESTAMMRVMRDEALMEPIRKAIKEGLPVLGTCAGMILLDDQHLGCMDVTVKRNAYGRQLGSFQTIHNIKGIGDVSMVFIRAPYIERCGEGVEVLSTLDGHVVAAKEKNMLACSFHPELTEDTRLHEYWLKAFVQQKS